MGLDADVMCRCWEDGLCNPPASLAPRLWYDPATAHVEQTTSEGLSAQERLALDLEYDRWIMVGACAHLDMCQASERISNWAGLRAFQDALRSLPNDVGVTLLREIPNNNGGETTPVAARKCLAELTIFA